MSAGRTVPRWGVILVGIGVVFAMGLSPTMATFAGDVLAPESPDADEALVLEPHPGPNGDYAFINDAGELEIVADKVSPESQATIDDVFTVRNNASRAVNLNISHDSEDTVVFDSNATTEHGAIQTPDGIIIQGNKTVAVGFHVDSGEATAGETLLQTVTFRATWASEATEETNSGSSSESYSVSPSSQTETPTPTDTPADAEPGPANAGEETPTPTPSPTPTTAETPATTQTTEAPQEVAGFGGRELWVLLALALGTITVGYAYRRMAG